MTRRVPAAQAFLSLRLLSNLSFFFFNQGFLVDFPRARAGAQMMDKLSLVRLHLTLLFCVVDPSLGHTFLFLPLDHRHFGIDPTPTLGYSVDRYTHAEHPVLFPHSISSIYSHFSYFQVVIPESENPQLSPTVQHQDSTWKCSSILSPLWWALVAYVLRETNPVGVR